MGRSEKPTPPLTDEQRCRFSLLKNVRYHEDREGHFAWINRALDLFVLVSGLGTVVALSDLLPPWARVDGRWIAAATSVVGAVQLVFALGRREALHADLRRRFLALLADLDAENAKDTGRRMRALFGDEPPTFHAVDKLAYNAAMTALDRPAASMIVVTPSQRIWRNWRRYEGVQFPRVGDAQAAAKGPAWWQRPKV
ncbi:hypothetical protein [Methylobacterium sp. Leaf91]|uniref:hypothetical protein n=1 Tax=Methylobacterium sp. Leaf91 TaxID=1736247 RepID=UPI0012E89336|nr:hypothetical protein [Methylobacterium sp. Leaf91]